MEKSSKISAKSALRQKLLDFLKTNSFAPSSVARKKSSISPPISKEISSKNFEKKDNKKVSEAKKDEKDNA